MKPDDFQKAYGKLVASAWADEAIKQRLIDSPEKVLEEYGIEVPEGIEVRILIDSAAERHIIIPEKPQEVYIEEVGSRDAAVGPL